MIVAAEAGRLLHVDKDSSMYAQTNEFWKLG